MGPKRRNLQFHNLEVKYKKSLSNESFPIEYISKTKEFNALPSNLNIFNLPFVRKFVSKLKKSISFCSFNKFKEQNFIILNDLASSFQNFKKKDKKIDLKKVILNFPFEIIS